MNPYHSFAAEFARLIREAKTFPLGTTTAPARPHPASSAPQVLIFSPHPDDEVIVGALALRLLRQSNWNITNIAVTQGSRKERQIERLSELRACCDFVGFNLAQTGPRGLENVNLKTRQQEPGRWADSVKIISALLDSHKPRVILLPHATDWNSTHIGTHFLVMDALKSLPPQPACLIAETEFWRPMDAPNLMVEVSPDDLGDLVAALTFHVGEVKRNPYHLTLPAWMLDNVRRGTELIGGQGSAAPEFTFGVLYRVLKWAGGQSAPAFTEGKFLSANDDPSDLFSL